MATPSAAAGVAGGAAPPTATQPNDQPGQHAREVEEREGFEYWGYLFKPDKTGTDKLKGLLRGLKEVMNTRYDSGENPDVTPTQLARFYRDLHGNYDQLFLGTPSESIAFIYKSLGCLHSLQPLPHSTAFTDPTVPALKTEGWIMWQTIQLLLGPEEHSSFLIEALQRWDVKDPATGQSFAKVLPRRCFPTEPDKHMVAWYEGVSERLRKEAEDEERQRQIEAEQAEVRRLHDKVRREDNMDDEESLDSRGPALAYFRNPLYRHVDGRPSIVRHNSKRPQLSPRPTSMIGKGKEAATSVGHVIRNIGSPHLWDGRKPSSSRSRERDRDRDRKRRSSYPENRFRPPGEVSAVAPYDSHHHSPDHRPPHGHHRRRSSHEGHSDHQYDADDSAAYSPREHPRHGRSHHDDYDPSLRPTRSHEPTPSQKESGDYFEGYDDPSRQNLSTPNASNNVGPSFGPSASPLFASHVAKQPQPPARPSPETHGPARMPPSFRHAQERPYSRSPNPSRSRHRDDRDRAPRRDDRGSHRYGSPRRSRYGSPGRDDGGPPSSLAVPPGHGPPPMGLHHHSQPGFPPVGAPITAPPAPYPSSSRDRRSHRTSGSDISGPPDDRDRDREQDRRSAPPKQTRFAAGVDGRRYPNETPWR